MLRCRLISLCFFFTTTVPSLFSSTFIQPARMVIYRRASARRRSFIKFVRSASIRVPARLRPFDGRTNHAATLNFLQDHSFKRLVQGAAVGAVVTVIIGFNWGGWSIESTAAKRADEASRTAVVAVLAPICVDKFQHSADATNNFVELKKQSTYMQGSFVEKGGWATSPGSDKANSAVASACATLLGNLK